MYLYIYDSCLKEKKYKNLLNAIENRTTDLDIKGKIYQLNLLKNVGNFIKEEIKKGAHTAVIVGNDKTLSHVIESSLNQNITFGYIPIDSKSELANYFGIPSGEIACNVVSGRIIEQIDVWEINQRIFIRELNFVSHKNTIIKIDAFKVIIEKGDKINIKNINLENNNPLCISDPKDEKLEICIEKPGKLFSKKSQHSLLRSKTISITSEDDSIPIVFDDFQTINTPVKIDLSKNKLNIIVGGNRKF